MSSLDGRRLRARTLAEQLLRRVTALDGRMYMGAGFHYVLVGQAHGLMVETCPERWDERSIDAAAHRETRHADVEIMIRTLLQTVQCAEATALRMECVQVAGEAFLDSINDSGGVSLLHDIRQYLKNVPHDVGANGARRAKLVLDRLIADLEIVAEDDV